MEFNVQCSLYCYILDMMLTLRLVSTMHQTLCTVASAFVYDIQYTKGDSCPLYVLLKCIDIPNLAYLFASIFLNKRSQNEVLKVKPIHRYIIITSYTLKTYICITCKTFRQRKYSCVLTKSRDDNSFSFLQGVPRHTKLIP